MKTIRVLVADDHAVVRSGLRALVDGCPGMRVVGEAGSGTEAVARARELAPDVVLMDVSMPGLGGASATERITREFPNVKVLALTAHEDRGHLTQLLKAGAAGYALKRAPADELMRAIRTVADGGTYVDPTLAGALLRTSAGAPAMRAAAEAAAPVLSDREEDVLRRVAWGESNKEIAARLGISTRTVETYKQRLTQKLGARSRTDLVRYAVERGWLNRG